MDLTAEERGRLLARLQERYPALVAPYQSYVGVGQASLATFDNVSVDRVGCGILAMAGGQSNGRRNQVFKLDLTVPQEVITAADERYLTRIELIRTEPWGVFRTSGENYILGVASQADGPLINSLDGNVRVPLEPQMHLWLYACDDGANTATSGYRSRIRIGRTQWMVTPYFRSKASGPSK